MNESKSTIAPIKDALSILAAFAGIMAAISAITSIADVGLQPILLELIEFYRSITAPLWHLINRFLRIDISRDSFDVSLIYALLVKISVSAELSSFQLYRLPFLRGSRKLETSSEIDALREIADDLERFNHIFAAGLERRIFGELLGALFSCWES